MNFGKLDFMILVGTTIALVGMSFVFPALGMVEDGDAADAQNIPEFDIEGDRFDFAGEFPRQPGTPSSDFLRWNDEDPDTETRDRRIGDEHRLSVTEVSAVGGQGDFWVLNVTLWNIPNNDRLDVAQFDENTTTSQSLSGESWDIAVDLVDTRGDEPDDFFGEVEFRVLDSPDEDSDGFFAGVPIVGGLVGFGGDVASMVGWIGAVINWFVAWTFTLVSNMLAVMIDSVMYVISLVSWLVSTYFAVVSAAPGWSSVIVLLPGILLSLELVKITWIAVWIIWIG